MTDFISDSLELLPQPAALFEDDGLAFVAANAEATRLADLLEANDAKLALLREGLRGGQSAREALRHVGLDADKSRRSIDERGYYARETPHGFMFLTKLETSPELTRPDLLLVTLLPGMERENAVMQNERMVSMLRINEAGYRSVRMMEDALMQMQAALSAQHVMLKETNHKAAEFFRMQPNIPVDRS